MAEAVGTAEDVKNVANYVLSLSGSPHDSVRAGLGKSKFTACAACHGIDGVGNQAVGAPNLADKIWLHGCGRGGDHRDDQQRQDQPDAGAGRAADRGADPRAGRLCLGPVEQAAAQRCKRALTETVA